MRKLILVFMLISGFAFGQFTVTDTSKNWTEVGKYLNAIKLYQNSEKTKAKIWYVDFNSVISTNILSPTTDYEFEFSTEPDTLDKLYTLIKDKLEPKNTEEITLDFPEGQMKISVFKTFGNYFANLHFDNKSAILDQNSTAKRETYGIDIKRLNKLFGKK